MNLHNSSLGEGARGDVVKLLHRELALIGLVVPDPERSEGVFGQGTVAAVRRFQQEHRIAPTGAVDDETASAINAAVNAITFNVDGRVLSRTRAGVGGLRVTIVDKNVGSDVRLAEAVADADGGYTVRFIAANPGQRRKERLDLQARVLAGETFLGASNVRYNASNRETLDVVLSEKSDASLPSEHETLVGSLGAHFLGSLRDLQETDEQQDITYLANKTGWDARAVALAALADQFSAKSADAHGTAIEAPFFYALFRAGVPANEDALYRTSSKRAAEIWKQGLKQGVIPAALETSVPEAVRQFQRIAAQRALDGPAPVGLSPLQEMLSVSLIDAPANRKKFAELYALHQGDPQQFWEAVRGAFGESAERRLRLDGQLAYLTLNNAPLVRRLHDMAGHNGLTDAASLAASGYYRAEKWREVIGDGAIPLEIAGENDGEKRSRYAEVLAAQVRLSFPTGVIAQMVKSGETPVTSGLADQVHAFLNAHQGKFEIGVQPVEQYLKRDNLQAASEVVREVSRIQRVHQITPSDDAMNALLKRGLNSAYAVTRYSRDQFVRSCGDELGGEANARLVYAKSQQVHNLVLNVAFSYLTAGIAPAIGRHSPNGSIEPKPKGSGSQAANASDVIAYPTLESLLGEMDFCTCEHCRSILSPAAYLVDLLHFLDREETWADELANWKTDHGTAPYPFTSVKAWNEAGQPTGPEVTPLQVFLERRPDIQHLPLTCDNTNKPLPYIDLVNETLEYFIANDTENLTLKGYQGHTTGADDQPEELLASPQFVRDAAYTILAGALFPAPLPFHQPLNNVRRYFDRFEAPLPSVMEVLRRNDDLERPAPVDPAHPGEYGWRDILMEELGLSRAEHKILTNYDLDAPLNTKLTLQQLFGFDPTDPANSEVNVVAQLSKAKNFTRRVGISYEELIEILKARFINPSSTLIPKLEALRVPLSTLKALKEGITSSGDAFSSDDFGELLPAGLEPAAYDGDPEALAEDGSNYAPFMGSVIKNWVTSAYEEIMGMIVVTNPDDDEDLCNFDDLEFRYSDPDKIHMPIRAFEFVRLVRFIRLWKKLGWTIEQTDKAITALYPADQAPNQSSDVVNQQRLDTGFLILLPRLGVIRRLMATLKLKPKKDLLPLLACFAPIDTHGDDSLYRKLFLSRALPKHDPAFDDDGFGNFLTAGGEKLLDHAEALRGAFLLTVDELGQISAALGFDENTELTVENISAVFRTGWLARRLKLSVRELTLLMRFTGLDPFTVANPTTPAILQLLELVQAMNDRSLKSAAALYLVWNQDLSGKSAPDPAQVTEFARTLRRDFADIENQFAATEDPRGNFARARMALVYGQEIADAFFQLVDDTLVLDVAYTHPAPTLEAEIIATDSAIGYDDFRHRLSHTGVLNSAMRDALKSVVGVTAAFQAAIDALSARSEDAKGSFFTRYGELEPSYDGIVALDQTLVLAVNYIHSAPTLEPAITAADSRIAYDTINHRLSYSGVLTAARRDKLKGVADVALTFQAAADALFARSEDSKGAVLGALQPELAKRRKRQQALQRLSAVVNTDLAFAQTILDSTLPGTPYPLHAAGHDDQPALTDVLALERPGLSVQLFASDTATGPSIAFAPIAANLDYAPAVGAVGNPLPPNPTPGAAISGIWSGQLEIPEVGFYNIVLEADAGANVTLSLGGQPRPLTQNGNVWRNGDPLELKAGVLYEIVLTVEKVKDVLRVKWETPKRAREVIPGRYLYPTTILAPFSDAYTRFLKVASLAVGLGLTANELAYFATRVDYMIGGHGWLNSLPVTGNADQSTSQALLKAFSAILQFARIKAQLSPDDERLLAVLRDPEAAAAVAIEGVDSPFFSLTHWDSDSLGALLARFGKGLADLAHIETLHRIYEAYVLLKQLGISASALINTATNEPSVGAVHTLQAALRARYDESDWLNVLKPINDEMRGLQRDALVAYVLHQMRATPATSHIDTPEKLFEYFLMDVEMEACMQTSRVRHALSSVQLFIERCFMHLEPRVAPSILEAKHWEWMKRYRVWEANRKVFLWPENWLDPELRDDQSPFFKEAMSELLQGDITEDRAAVALGNYLSKLEEVAKLEPCGIYYVEGESGISPAVAHVVARTAGANRKYYYRRRDGADGPWTPWEQIKLDIEDNPVIPVVWKGRLFLFWLRILKQTPLDPPDLPTATTLDQVNPKEVIPSDSPEVTVQALLCWSEYYNGKWQTIRTSDVNSPTFLEDSVPFGPYAFDRSDHVLSSIKAEAEGGLLIYDFYQSTGLFILYNSHSLPIRVEEDKSGTEKSALSILAAQHFRYLDASTDTLTITYQKNILPESGPPLLVLKAKDGMPSGIVDPLHNLNDMWEAPFFYEDRRHVFYVTTKKVVKPMKRWTGYVQLTDENITLAQMLPLVFEKKPVPGPLPVEMFVSEDAYINKQLQMTGTVLYDGVAIGQGGKHLSPIGG
jgi:ABC toxin N-terminal region/Neuraminidase-like domain/Putative peptidoglycan binding domain